MWVERVELKHERNVAVRCLHVLDWLAVNNNFARVDILQAGDCTQGGGLAATRRPEQHYKFAVLDLQI